MLPKYEHEIRDPIHTFIRVSSEERRAIDSRPFQRLRDIHQLALTYLLYPGATHTRFEHCLGVMELAGRVFDVLVREDHRHNDARLFFPPSDKLQYWRMVVRMGALCHDLGHIPFSHGAEELLPEGYHHEQLSVDVILSLEMKAIWDDIPLKATDVAKIAVGVKKWPGPASDFSPWDELMTEIVTGDAFGVDRIDYLLRDSHHAGVAYGRFDHYRLIDTLRILPSPDPDKPGKPVIGIERGGLHAAEALQLARYFMFEQLYFHHVRRALDLHLKEYLRALLPNGTYPIDVQAHLSLTDNEVLAAMRKAVANATEPGHEAARRILKREFYRVLYTPSARDLETVTNPTEAVYHAATERFGGGVALEIHNPPAKSMSFAVERSGGEIVSSLEESQILQNIPTARFAYVFIVPEKLHPAREWITANIRGILDDARKENR